MRRLVWRIVLAGLFIAIAPNMAAASSPGNPPDQAAGAGPLQPPKLKATLLANAETASPGEAIELAVRIEIEKPWHMYHPIVLDSGGATLLTFHAPAGVEFGEVRYPKPTLEKMDEFEFLAYEGELVLLTRAMIAKTVSERSTIPIEVEVDGYACQTRGCVPAHIKAALVLPVSAARGKPANEELFKQAGAPENFPPILPNATYLEGSKVEITKSELGLREPAEIVATIKVRPDHHIQHRHPGNDDLIASRIFIEKVDGIEFGPERWPEGKRHNIPDFGEVTELSGEFSIRVPFQIIDARFPRGPVVLRVLFQYQCCNDAGTCYPPEMAESVVRFTAKTDGKPVAAGELSTLRPRVVPLSDAQARDLRMATTAEQASVPDEGPQTLLQWLIVFGAAFLGGVILNIMPCVLPVISLKILSFMQQAGQEPRRVRAMGLMYAAGILASFAIMAIVLIAAGRNWGGLMQYPQFVIGLIAVVFAFALSLMGVFELRLPGAIESAAGAASTHEGFGGAFLNGILATALATPCVGPFLGWAAGILLQMPWWVAGAGVMTIGAGLAAPYVLLTWHPAWLRFLPKPGKWMVTFKQFTGFLMVGTLVWLLFVLQYMVPTQMLVATIAFLAFVGMACWMIGQLSLTARHARVLATYGAVVCLLIGGGMLSFRWLGAPDRDALPVASGEDDTPVDLDHVAAKIRPSADGQPIAWQAWHPGLPELLAKAGYTVYVDFTAKWCGTCQWNKHYAVRTDEVEALFRRNRVVALLADYTNYSKTIEKELRRFRRAGVPLNVIYPATKPDGTITLPETLSVDTVAEALKQAGPSTAAAAAALSAAANP